MNKNKKIDPKKYKGILIQYQCQTCKIYDIIEEDFQSDIAKIKSDSCGHFSFKFIFDLEKKSYKYLLSFNCNKCGTNHFINIFNDNVDFENGIHYKCKKCGNGPLDIFLFLSEKDDNNKDIKKDKNYKTSDGENDNKNNNKEYRTAGEDNSEINPNFNGLMQQNVLGGDKNNQQAAPDLKFKKAIDTNVCVIRHSSLENQPEEGRTPLRGNRPQPAVRRNRRQGRPFPDERLLRDGARL